VQDGFLAIWRSRASYREGVAGFQGWAMTIVRNRAIDSTRRAAARPQLPMAEGGHDRAHAQDDAISTQDAVSAESEQDAMLTSVWLLP